LSRRRPGAARRRRHGPGPGDGAPYCARASRPHYGTKRRGQRRLLPYLPAGSPLMAECVLIVEDDPSILRGLQMNIGLEGFRTICARDGDEALDLARSHKPDVILLDMMLPRLGGIDVIKKLRVD